MIDKRGGHDRKMVRTTVAPLLSELRRAPGEVSAAQVTRGSCHFSVGAAQIVKGAKISRQRLSHFGNAAVIVQGSHAALAMRTSFGSIHSTGV
ncbi:unnamed protein product [Lampetra planeri]